MSCRHTHGAVGCCVTFQWTMRRRSWPSSTKTYAVLDAYSRRIVGWSIADHVRSDLVVDALEMACWRRRPPRVETVMHSDRGSQYTSWAFGHRLRAAGLLGSMGRVASAVDNSMMESFFGTLQLELLDTRTWRTRAELNVYDGAGHVVGHEYSIR